MLHSMAILLSAPPSPATVARRRLRVAFGPETPGWGSWNWVGADLVRELAAGLDTRSFGWGELPEGDVCVIVKHLLPRQAVERLARRAAVIYAPVDGYGGEAEIADDAASLRLCKRIVVHCERLRPFFEPYAPVTYMDHHVKFASREMANGPAGDGERFVLWAGVRSNLPPLVDWVNRHGVDLPLVVLTNLEPGEQGGGGGAADNGRNNDRKITDRRIGGRTVGESTERDGELARAFGFAGGLDVRVEDWSAERQRELTATAAGAIDIKGDDFRQRHKPPAKAIDFIASGLPLAMNDSSSTEHLARLGFEIASPHDTARWFSRAYREETVAFGRALRELLSLKRIASRWRRLLSE
jgi:hypothetical protein